VRIIGWDPRYASDVARLSRERIERDFVSKPEDEAYYADPAGRVIAAGGEIFLAFDRDAPDGDRPDVALGTCAAAPRTDGSIELSKLAVTERANGRGAARRRERVHGASAQAARLSGA
jgi:hypothetical protein